MLVGCYSWRFLVHRLCIRGLQRFVGGPDSKRRVVDWQSLFRLLSLLLPLDPPGDLQKLGFGERKLLAFHEVTELGVDEIANTFNSLLLLLVVTKCPGCEENGRLTK